MQKKVIVVGGGAAGLMAAGAAAKRGLDVEIYDKNPRPARKLMITGKGRCNLTNNCDVTTLISNVVHGGKFLYSAFSAFSPADTMEFFESLGVRLKTERGRRVFPQSDKAADIVDALSGFARREGAEYINAEVSKIIIEDGRARGVVLTDGSRRDADAVIICTGGKSYPSTGSTGDGYKFAAQAGHSVTGLTPSLVPLVIKESFCRDLQGLTLKNVAVSLTKGGSGKAVYNDFGELLFTHFGISGPIALSASAHIDDIEKNVFFFHIDLKPALDNKKLYDRINRDLDKYSAKTIENALVDLLPHRMIPVILRTAEIPFCTKAAEMTREYRNNLVSSLKDLRLTVTDFLGINSAVITRGGVSLREIDPKTMQSKLAKDLYFAGEVLDADAYTGGYNLQIAFSTGYAAGMGVLKEG